MYQEWLWSLALVRKTTNEMIWTTYVTSKGSNEPKTCTEEENGIPQNE
jgi:hypothetical protein